MMKSTVYAVNTVRYKDEN